MTIKINKLNKQIGNSGSFLSVLTDVCLTARTGHITSILGPSGCGKSTLLNIIAGLDFADCGYIDLDACVDTVKNTIYSEANTKKNLRLGNVAYMQQKDLLLPWRTVIENIALSLEIKGNNKLDSLSVATAYLADFGLVQFADNYPHSLSGGMKQRIAFLRTMLTESPIILLDEPFSSLDSLTRINLQIWFMDVISRISRTVVLVTHDVEEAVFMSDKIYVMSERPGHIENCYEVDFPRPRNTMIISDSKFMAIKSNLLRDLGVSHVIH